MKPLKLDLAHILASTVGCSSPCRTHEATDRDVLRALLAEADHLGVDPDGQSWLLVRTTPQLVLWLEQMDAATDDHEQDDLGEENGDEEPSGDEREPSEDFEPAEYR